MLSLLNMSSVKEDVAYLAKRMSSLNNKNSYSYVENSVVKNSYKNMTNSVLQCVLHEYALNRHISLALVLLHVVSCSIATYILQVASTHH